MIDFSGRAMRAGTRGIALLAAVAGFAVLPQLAHGGPARADGSGGRASHHHHQRAEHQGAGTRPGIDLHALAPRGGIVPGRTYKWPYSVTNNGTTPAKNVTLETTPDPDLKVVATPPKCTWHRASVLVCRVGLIPRGRTRRGSITATVNPRAHIGKSVSSPARLSWQNVPAADERTVSPSAMLTQTAEFPPVAISPTTDLAVTSTVPDQVGPSDAPYRISVTNDGPVTAESVVVRGAIAPDGRCADGSCAMQRLNFAACGTGCEDQHPSCDSGCSPWHPECDSGCPSHRFGLGCDSGCAPHRFGLGCDSGCASHHSGCDSGCAFQHPACDSGCAGSRPHECGTGSCGTHDCGCRWRRPVEVTPSEDWCGGQVPCSTGPVRVREPGGDSDRRGEACGGERNPCGTEPVDVSGIANRHPGKAVHVSPISFRHHRRCVAQGTGFVCPLGAIPPGKTRTLQLAVHGRPGEPARRLQCLSTVRSGTPDSNMANNRSVCHTRRAHPLPVHARPVHTRPVHASAPTRSLPATGGSFDTMALWGLGLGGVGVVLFGLGRLRRGEQG